MTKAEIKTELERLTKEAAKLNELYNSSDTDAARKWLKEFIEIPFDNVVAKEGKIKYFRGVKWLFELDLKNKILWYSYNNIWKILSSKHSMNDTDIQFLIQEVVGETLNCKGFTAFHPRRIVWRWVGETLNCKGFTANAPQWL